MPILHSIVHLIDKQPDGQPATLHGRDSELAITPALEDLLESLNDSYNGKPKSWGFFNADSATYPFSTWLARYLDGEMDFNFKIETSSKKYALKICRPNECIDYVGFQTKLLEHPGN